MACARTWSVLTSALSGLAEQGNDVGGETVNNWIRALADMQEVLAEFQRRRIFIKDLQLGLAGFPGHHRRTGGFSLLGTGRGGHRILARPRHGLHRTRAALKISGGGQDGTGTPKRRRGEMTSSVLRPGFAVSPLGSAGVHPPQCCHGGRGSPACCAGKFHSPPGRQPLL